MTDESPRVGDVIDKYEVDGVVGRGGMGAVFRARHVMTGRAVALKWMLPGPSADAAAVQRFVREARAMGRIDHPNVVGVLDVGVGDGSAYLVMELLRGNSLRAYLEREERIEPARAVSLLLPALEGVAAAHHAGVVHRDLKPENLFVVERDDGRIVTTKVLDFGISKLREDGPQPSAITQTGTTMGTPSYMSPEQVQGARDVDARTDVWALGAILYEMVTGRVPFRAQTYGALMVAIVTEPLVPSDVVAPGLPRELARVIDRALEKDPADRFESVDALRDALAPLAAESSQPRLAPTTRSGEAARPATPRPSERVDMGRPSATPTRPARPERAPAIELESGAMRAREAEAQPSVPLSVPDLPTRGGRRAMSPRRMVAILAVACAVPIAAVALHALTRPRSEPSTPAATTRAEPTRDAAAETPRAEPTPSTPAAVTETAALEGAHDGGTPNVAEAPDEAPLTERAAALEQPSRPAVPAREPRRARATRERGTTTTRGEASPSPSGRSGQLSRDDF